MAGKKKVTDNGQMTIFDLQKESDRPSDIVADKAKTDIAADGAVDIDQAKSGAEGSAATKTIIVKRTMRVPVKAEDGSDTGETVLKTVTVRKVVPIDYVPPQKSDADKGQVNSADNAEASVKESAVKSADVVADIGQSKSVDGEDKSAQIADAQPEAGSADKKSSAEKVKTAENEIAETVAEKADDGEKSEEEKKKKEEEQKRLEEERRIKEEKEKEKQEAQRKKLEEEQRLKEEKEKERLEARQKKQEEKEQKKAEKQKEKQAALSQKNEYKEKLKTLKTTPFENFLSTAEEGLNDAQVEEREIRGLTNAVDNSISKSYLKIFTTNIFTLFNLLNIFLACLIIIFNGQVKNMLFAIIALVNLVIGIFQEIRSKKALDKLSLVSAPSIEAVRNGQVIEISTDQIVIDDVIILKQGSQVPTDCIVVGGECEANESLLTGEQDDIHKGDGDRLMSGSFVQSGTCRARVIAVGEDTYASKLMNEAKKFKKSKSELMRSINWIIRIATIIIFPLGILMFFTNMKHADSISGAVTSTVSSVIGMIPEGLVMLTSIALALGIIRLAKRRTLVQDLYSIEALARVDVLCLDKTGTITEGSMQVESVHVYSSKFGSPDDIMANMVKALGANNATFEACAEYFSSNETYHVSKLMPFSSARKWSGTTFKDVGTFIVGAPEFVLRDRYSIVERNVNEYAMQGYRVLVLVTTPEQLKDEQMDTSKMELIALIVLSDKIRSTAAATFEYFEQQGVELKVISGDNPLTVSKVAERAGMKNAEKYIDASVDLDTPDKIYEAAEKYTVFGRVSPSQKKQLVAALKAHGHTVGMTGDGVNDVMALKESDCSIAMASGSEASRNVAQLVLLDSDFSALPSVVSEGRRVINNIERASSLFLVKTTFSAVLSLLLIIFQFSTYPFEPIQLTLINALFVGVPSFILALEPNDRRVKGNFLSKVFKRALPAGLTVAFAILLVCWQFNDINSTFDVSPQISTMSVFITATVSYIVLVQVCMPYTKDKVFMLALLLVAFIFVVSSPFLSEKFSLVTLYPKMTVSLAIIIVCIIPIMAFMRVEIEAFKALFKETGGFIKREKDRAREFFNRFDNKR